MFGVEGDAVCPLAIDMVAATNNNRSAHAFLMPSFSNVSRTLV